MQSLSFLMPFYSLLLLLQVRPLHSCNKVDHDSLILFHQHISSSPPLNWSSGDCCQWEGIICNSNNPDLLQHRVTRLSLSDRGISGTITPFLRNLTFLSYLNLSHNHLSGPFPYKLPISVQTVDLSSNRFNGSIDPVFFHLASNLIIFNVSNNRFIGSLPSSACKGSGPLLLQILDFSHNRFTGNINGIGGCSSLKVFRAGFNSLSGFLPYDLYNITTLKELSLSNNHLSGPINNSISMLSNLLVLELHVNELSGEIPREIGLLSSLEQLQLHTNNFNGTLPPSLTNCSNLTILLLRNNQFGSELSTLNFSNLQKLEVIDLGNNSFVGHIPRSLCLCRSLTAVRLAYNRLIGEVPSCMASLESLAHLSFSNNYLSNVAGALKILRQCDNLTALFMSRCFNNEMLPDGDNLNGFNNLQILTLAGCKLKGQIPSWIAKLRKLKVLNLSYNRISGPVPAWLGSMPSLFALNLTQNFLTGDLPPEIGQMPAFITSNTSLDLNYLALPFLFRNLEYNRLLNLPRGFKVGSNNLSGRIPTEISQLKLLQLLDLSNNNFNGDIPDQFSKLVNMEKLDLSGNNLSGKIPPSLAMLHFMSAFNVSNNDLEGEIPRASQFDTFPASSFDGNPKLCGHVLGRSCPLRTHEKKDADDDEDESISWYIIPFGVGYLVGFFAVSLTYLFCIVRVSSVSTRVYSDYYEVYFGSRWRVPRNT